MGGMDATDYHRLRKRIEDRHSARLREIDIERDNDLAALNRVCEIAGFDPAVLTEQTVSEHDSDSGIEDETTDRGSVSKLVGKAVSFIGADVEFTFHDVQSAIRDWQPSLELLQPNAITQVLRRMVELGHIRVHEQGQGRRPTSYVRSIKE